ncbi:MAG: hypothetical protein GY811_08515 [Myxococcales bacterium]|nr:hypothetical protein [Myxococcales bacterium]
MVTKAGRKGRQAALVTWREGIHLTGTSIWCDAIRARDICFLSSASAMRGARHAQLIASQDSFKLLGNVGSQTGSRLAPPFGQPFTLGTHRIELFSSGHALGSAQLLVKLGAHKIVYAGTVNPRGSTVGCPLDHRSTDTLVISARYGAPRFDFPDQENVLAQLGDRCEQIARDRGVAVLLVGDTGKALDLASRLSERCIPLQAHRSFHDAARRSRPDLFSDLRRWSPSATTGRILLWPVHTRSRLESDALPKGSDVFLVSGQALEPLSIEAAGASEGFALSNQADHGELVQYIRSSGAGQVYLTHTCDQGAGLRKALPKLKIETIGPPEQLSLFTG